MNSWLRRFVFGALLVPLMFLGSSAFAASAQSTKSPEAVLKAFYSWYIRDVQAMKIPIDDDKKMLRKYVSGETLRWIDSLSRSGTYDADYFLKSQDVLDDWPDHVAVSDIEIHGQTAAEKVFIGAARNLKLDVFMTRDGGTWKIRMVRKASD